MGDNKSDSAQPLAKTRTRRANAGARMHEIMFNAEEDEVYRAAYGDLLKNDDDSSDDEEYIPKDLEPNDAAKGADADADDDGDDDGDDGGSTSGSCSDSASSDDDDEEDDEEDEEDDDDDNDEEEDDSEVNIVGQVDGSKQWIKGSPGARVKQEGGMMSQRQLKSQIQPGTPSREAFASCKKICAVCLGDQSGEDDEIIECDSCGVSVHESCYGVGDADDDDNVNANESENNNDNADSQDKCDNESVHSNISSESTEPWFCEPCKRSVKNPHCELCPNLGGIFKETDTGQWVHMVCALYTCGITFNNIDSLTEVSLFEIDYAKFGSKTCTICEDRRLARSGLCIDCDAGLCKTFFHATCAQKEGLLFESHSDEVDPYFAQCKLHADKTVIKKKKKLFIALFARLRRFQSIDNRSERVKRKLQELVQKPDPHLSRWTPDNRPPIPNRMPRMLLTSPSLIMKLTKKSELMGLDPKSAAINVPDEIEMARLKWHVPPTFDLEFVAYCHDRKTRMISMTKQNTELLKQNVALKMEEANLRERHDDFEKQLSSSRLECEKLVQQARALQKMVATSTGEPYHLPGRLEQLISKCPVAYTKGRSTAKTNKTANNKTSTTYGCGKCKTVKDQHLLALCDTCNKYLHIYCIDPPLTRVPKKTKFGGWQCSDCTDREEEEQEEAIEEQNKQAIQEKDGPRRLREHVKNPEKYVEESMMLADFWSTNKRRSRKRSSGGSKKKPKIEIE